MFNIFFPFPFRISLPENQVSTIWNFSNEQEVLRVQEKYIKLKPPKNLIQKFLPLDRVEARSALFTELQSYWTVPLNNISVVAGLAITKGTKNDGTDDIINVLTTNPLKIFSINQESDKIQETLLYELINYEESNSLRFTMATDNNQNILLHEEIVSIFELNQFFLIIVIIKYICFQNNVLLLLNLNEGTVRKIEMLSFFDVTSNKITNALKNMNIRRKMKSDLLKSHNQIVFYSYNSNKIEVIDLNLMCFYTINLPFRIQSILLPSEKKWLIDDTERNKYILKKSTYSSPCPNILLKIEESSKHNFKIDSFLNCTNNSLNSNLLSAALKQKIDSPNRLLVSDNTYANIAVGFPDLDSFNELYSWPRAKSSNNFTPTISMDNGQIVKVVTPQEVPDDVFPKTGENYEIARYLEIVDIVNHKLRYIPVPK